MLNSIKAKLKSITATDILIAVAVIGLLLLIVGVSVDEPSSAIVLK
jgi:hypothetical protein